MKLNKAEIAAIVITIIFIVVAVISPLGDSNERSVVTISAGNSVSAEDTASQLSSSQTPENSSQASVNINTASSQELCALPGIGKTLAARIIAYRDEHGLFNSIDEIMSVAGIGAKTYEDIKYNITAD